MPRSSAPRTTLEGLPKQSRTQAPRSEEGFDKTLTPSKHFVSLRRRPETAVRRPVWAQQSSTSWLSRREGGGSGYPLRVTTLRVTITRDCVGSGFMRVCPRPVTVHLSA